MNRPIHIRIYDHWISIHSDITGIFKQSLYFVLIPVRNFQTIRGTLMIQYIGYSLVGSTRIIKGKHTIHRLLF